MADYMEDYMFAVNLEEARRDIMEFIDRKVMDDDYENAEFEYSVLEQVVDFFEKRRFLEKDACKGLLRQYSDKGSLCYDQVKEFINKVADDIKEDSGEEYDLVYMA